MKKMISVLALAFLMSCDNSGGSTEQKLDSLGEKLQNSAERTFDSAKEKAKDLKEKVEGRLEDRDSLNRKDSLKDKN